MHYAFQTPKNLYMVLDFCPNGDLLAHLQERLKFGESVCRFYCAEILVALEYLHSLDIVYRDLKPENILVDRAGHILMADFGLAKENVNSMNPAMSFCGSPAYLAPELLNKQGSEKSADVYSYGAIMYEMLTGLPPFYSENIKELFKNIKNAQLQFPASVRAEAKDLIKKVMNRDASRRPTISQLKRHPFFREVDWDLFLAKKVRPPRLGPSWKQVDDDVEGVMEVDYNAQPSGLVIDEDYKEGVEDDELVDEFNY
jgi:protein-serine/threonine kinase